MCFRFCIIWCTRRNCRNIYCIVSYCIVAHLHLVVQTLRALFRVVRCEANVAGSIRTKWRTCIKHYSVSGAKRTSFSKQRKQHPVGPGCADGLFHTSIGIDCACHPGEVQHGRGGNTHLVSVFGRRGRCLPESISGYVCKSSLVI